MVTVAAVALGSSTYAWFANNNKVTADGLNIKAQTEGAALVISDTEGGTAADTAGTSTSLAFANAVSLYPTHVNMGNEAFSGFAATGDKASAAGAWTHATSDKFDTAITAATSESNLTIAEGSATGVMKGTDGKGFDGDVYITDDMYIAVKAGNQYGNLYVSKCGITGATAQMLNAARVLMVVTDKNNAVKTYEFSPNGVLNAEGNAQTIVNTDKFTALTGTNVDLGVVDGTEMHVQVFVYFDGRDNDCTSAKYDTNEISVSLEFTGANPSAASA